MLKKIFEEIKKENKYYASFKDGIQFGQKFKSLIKKYGYSEILQRNKTHSAIEKIKQLEEITLKNAQKKYSDLKNKILEKNSLETIKNPFQNIKKTFIFEPFGSQQFPDFIVINPTNIISIQIKFSKNNKKLNGKIGSFRPMWNSNIPKPNAIYIYGVSGERITFFLGSEILEQCTRKLLLNFFNNMNNKKKELDKELIDLSNNFGIYPYIRKAYEHKKTKSTFKNEKGKQVMESYFSKNAEKRERNVIDFLDSLNEK